MGNIKKHCISGNADHTGKYEATHYCSMCDNPQVLRSVRAFGIERLQCCIDVNGHHFEHF